MKKIGIITINDNNNYGNRLQNYALEKYLNEHNWSADTICICNKKQILKNYIKKILFLVSRNTRKSHFYHFSKKHIKTKYYKNYSFVSKYDYFVVGSDQVWNPHFASYNSNMFLKFSNKDKNISYAASFGVNDIPNEYLDEFKIGINNIKNISVRETQGKKIIEDLTGRQDVEVLLDPTMLLTDREWDKIIKKPKQYKEEKYILLYFLGNINENYKKEIYKFAKKNKLEIINILDKNSKYYNCGPSEFLFLERNAKLICTDSFHSSVFAIIFHKHFLVFEREDKEKNMNSRLTTLLEKFDLKENKYTEGEIKLQLFRTDFNLVEKKLEKERVKTDNFFKNSLK